MEGMHIKTQKLLYVVMYAVYMTCMYVCHVLVSNNLSRELTTSLYFTTHVIKLQYGAP